MTISASEYHRHTSYHRDKMTAHHLDWRNQPNVFKDYPGLSPIVLPSNLPLPEEKLSSILGIRDARGRLEQVDSETFSLILRLASTITAKAFHADVDHFFRSAASAGALYPTEIYVTTHSVTGLDDGLYHFAVHRHGLYTLRTGDLSGYIIRTTQTSKNKRPALTFFLTAIFFRSVWKYRDRAYRYHLLDTGHVMGNLVMGLNALRLSHSLSYDFDDQRVNHLLGLDETKEVCLAVTHAYTDHAVSVSVDQKLDSLHDAISSASQVSAREIDCPIIREFHQSDASKTLRATPGPETLQGLGVAPEIWKKTAAPTNWPEVMNYSAALYHRRSKRNFLKKAISQDSHAALISSILMEKSPLSVASAKYDRSLFMGFLADDVEGMEPGFYLLDFANKSIGLVKRGFFIERMAHVCLDQMWLKNAAVHFLFLANTEYLDHIWGARGYRYAMLRAGQLGQSLYVSAAAMGLGCCGIGAFYDEEAAKLLGLNDTSSLLYLVAIGPVKSTPSSKG
ncbi:MAG: SagB/ThcOx family dehydrogenase [Deltaproteobacteria bacterium]|nr:SagB/ThcOx family dehydrogenase [Deltaproteobacteria bacterium]